MSDSGARAEAGVYWGSDEVGVYVAGVYVAGVLSGGYYSGYYADVGSCGVADVGEGSGSAGGSG